MKISADESRERFTAARVARLATATAVGQPHLVPIVFGVSGDVIYTAVDAKPKSTTSLRRLANIAANPKVSILVDQYAEDWTQLWWTRADGAARIIEIDEPEAAAALSLLVARYAVYRTAPPPGPMIAIDVERWSGWSGAG
jgi:PPOX class probable F420-dependent enzyme